MVFRGGCAVAFVNFKPEVGDGLCCVYDDGRNVIPQARHSRSIWDKRVCGVAGIVGHDHRGVWAGAAVSVLPEEFDLSLRILLHVPELTSSII